MLVSSRLKLAIVLWLALEVIAFECVAELIGVPRTILLGVITSLFGLILLRRAGTAALLKLRSSFEGRAIGERDKGHFLGEMLATVGALALLLPGFLSDLVGLALSLPLLRDRAARWITRRGFGIDGLTRDGAAPRTSATTIDLDPDEWRRAESARPDHEVSPSR